MFDVALEEQTKDARGGRREERASVVRALDVLEALGVRDVAALEPEPREAVAPHLGVAPAVRALGRRGDEDQPAGRCGCGGCGHDEHDPRRAPSPFSGAGARGQRDFRYYLNGGDVPSHGPRPAHAQMMPHAPPGHH